MVRAQIVIKDGTTLKHLEEMTFNERPLVGSEIGGKYKVLSISSPVPIGTNLSAGEPEMGIRIRVEELRQGEGGSLD